jgi:integrase
MDLSLKPVEVIGAFTKRKEKRVNASSYQEGWIEWRTKSNGKKACRFRYWVRDDASPEGWRKAATPWEEGLTLKQAKQHLRDLMARMEQTPPQHVVPVKKGLTLNEFVKGHWEVYQRNRGTAASTRGSHAATLKNHILPVFGESSIRAVSPSDISNFFQELNVKKLSQKSVLNIYQLLHVMFEVAVEHDLIEANPVRRKLHRPKHLRKKMPIWTAESVQKILHEIPDRWKVLFCCIALTGVRIGELLALQWKDIDWTAKTITFGKGFWRGRLLETTKTGQQHVRHMPAGLEHLLSNHLQKTKNIGPEDFVFCRSDEDARPHDPDDLRREVLYPVLDRCCIKRTPRADGFHAFRRATSKFLRKASGLELAAVQLGHKRMTTTDEHYNDRDLDDLKRAAELVETAFGINFAPKG